MFRARTHDFRRNIDPEALKVLYRLHEYRYAAYLVGGGPRLLLGWRPKDFDIGTDAHPYQIKKMFRNCGSSAGVPAGAHQVWPEDD